MQIMAGYLLEKCAAARARAVTTSPFATSALQRYCLRLSLKIPSRRQTRQIGKSVRTSGRLNPVRRNLKAR
jgi:hypothetical protein